MMAAAHAAAEAALREVDEHRNMSHQHSEEPSEAALAALLQQVVEHGDPQQFIAATMANPDEGEGAQYLLQMMAQQEEQRQQFAAFAAMASRPSEHYISIAQNGTILEATETVTGIPPNALLMTSIFDTVYDDDLPGLLAIKTHFWDKGRPDVPAYIRRRTLEGDWVWLISTVASYTEQPISGYIFLEKRAPDDEIATKINRITRIAAIVVQAVEASLITGTGGEGTVSTVSESLNTGEIPLVSDDASTYQSWLGKAYDTSGMAPADRSLQNIMNAAVSVGSGELNGPAAVKPPAAESTKKPNQGQMEQGKEAFDPLAEIKALKTGICLDMGMIRLAREELKMIVLVLSGRLPAEDIGQLVIYAMNTPSQDLGGALDRYVAETPLPSPQDPIAFKRPPAITVLNLSFTYIGNRAVKVISEILYMDHSPLTTIDVSFCGLEEKGLLAFARGLASRKRKGLPALRGVFLSGNYMSYRAAKGIGQALSSSLDHPRGNLKTSSRPLGQAKGGAEYADSWGSNEGGGYAAQFVGGASNAMASSDGGLRVLHLASASVTPDALYQLLCGLGADCPVRELSIHSNRIGRKGASLLVEFLEGKGLPRGQTVMPHLNRLDLSNNELGNDGTAKLTRAIAKRSKVDLVDLRLSSNDIGAGGVETILNKLLQHNIISLSLDKNTIGDQGCQLVAAALQSMHQLARLNLSFNDIGSRGVNTLMKTLVCSESITYLGLSGNTLRISGAIAMGFTLAQHPRLEELELDNCCLSEAAQCHIVAGIISNRWVPLKRLTGFQAAPPMVALGALDVSSYNLSNEECFRLRRDEQMKTILQWMESNRAAKLRGQKAMDANQGGTQDQYLTPDFVSSVNDVQGIPSQNAYLRMLGWLSRIPFDEDELTVLRKYFYDADGGEGDRGSDGYINLKLRGDLLAALDSDVADELRDALPEFLGDYRSTVGLDLDLLDADSHGTSEWGSPHGMQPSSICFVPNVEKEMAESDGYVDAEAISDLDDGEDQNADTISALPERNVPDLDVSILAKRRRIHSAELSMMSNENELGDACNRGSMRSSTLRSSLSSLSRQSIHSESDRSNKGGNALKARIAIFPPFEQKLEELKATAKEMIESEEDPSQQDVILTQYAEASLTILRQLRYHCMNTGLDGWRQAGLRRKVLVIDDSLVTRKLVARAFEKANFIVDTAVNGVEGVKKMKQGIYDIAFMDIDMPVMNGFEATKALRQWEDLVRPGARQPICALTAAYVDDFERSELMKFKEAGLDVMESKPCNIPRLFKVVDDVSPMFSDLSISLTQRETGPVA